MLGPIKEKQEKVKQASQILGEIRQLMPPDNEGKKAMTQSVFDGCKTLGITIKGNVGDELKKDEWERNVEIIKNFMDRLNYDIQNDMVKLQSLMGQYNKFLQPATDAMNKAANAINNQIMQLPRGGQ